MVNSHQGRKGGNARSHAKVAGRSLVHHTCLTTGNDSNAAKQLKNNAEHTDHQYQRRQRHQRRNGANSIGARGALSPEQSAPLPGFEPLGLGREM